MNRSNRLIFNTTILYLKLIISILIGLYSTRLVLEALGIVEFGIFSLVGGILFSLAIINASMTVSVQRFLSFELGQNNPSRVKAVFSNSIILYGIISTFFLLTMLLIEAPIFTHLLDIPINRIQAARTVYKAVAIAIMFSCLSVPFEGLINAKENMILVGLVGIFESILKLFSAIYLFHTTYDRLVVYGVAISAITFLKGLTYTIFSIARYSECNFALSNLSIPLWKKLASFTFWNTFGVSGGMFRTQGIAFVFNIFGGTVANASNGVAHQVYSQINTLTAMMLKPLNPQIMSSEGANDRPRVLKLVRTGNKFSFISTALFAIPLYSQCEYVLTIWLKTPPPLAVEFCKLLLIVALFRKLTITFLPMVQAIGRIKLYQVALSSTHLLIVVIAYILLRGGYPFWTAYLGMLVMDMLMTVFDLFIAKKMVNLSISKYLKDVHLPLVSIAIISFSSTKLISELISTDSFSKLILIVCTSSAVLLVTSWYMAINEKEKVFIKQKTSTIALRVKNLYNSIFDYN
jgi:O-antigen/teichoic acid export membrane protein